MFRNSPHRVKQAQAAAALQKRLRQKKDAVQAATRERKQEIRERIEEYNEDY